MPELEHKHGLYVVVCRDCGTWYWSTLKPTGSKWTSLCGSCLRWEL